jgi:hypothetical protein
LAIPVLLQELPQILLWLESRNKKGLG